MEDSFPNVGRCLSILDRQMKMYYDRSLAGFAVGWGQQFYVEYLYDHPGASAQEMASAIRVDKATLTKVIKKLTQEGYVEIRRSQRDKRVKCLYLTDLALPAAREIKAIHQRFYQALCAGLPPEEVRRTEATMERMMARMTDALTQMAGQGKEGPHGA